MMLLMRGSNKSLDFLKISFDRKRTASAEKGRQGGEEGMRRGNKDKAKAATRDNAYAIRQTC